VVDKRFQAALEPTTAALTSSGAIKAFLGLLQAWKLAPARGWRMLTGLGYRAGSLTPDQIARVQHLVAIDAGMRTIKGDAVGEWMVAGNGSGVTSGAAPMDFLTRSGTETFMLKFAVRWRPLSTVARRQRCEAHTRVCRRNFGQPTRLHAMFYGVPLTFRRACATRRTSGSSRGRAGANSHPSRQASTRLNW
jgi:hypothetical protein